MKSILLINGNPKSDSFVTIWQISMKQVPGRMPRSHASICQSFADANLSSGYDQEQLLEPDLQRLQTDLLNADHIVMLAPIWWGGLPATSRDCWIASSCRASPLTTKRVCPCPVSWQECPHHLDHG